MSDVWNVAHHIAWITGWIVMGVCAVVAYFSIGIRVAKSIQIFHVASTEVRYILATIWPLIACGKVVGWLVRRTASLIGHLIGVSVQIVSLDPSAQTAPVAVPQPKLVAGKPGLGAYRSEESDGDKLKRLYAERQQITRQITEITNRMAKKSQPKDLSN